ncbi:MAG: MBL fold metallo-hydrolase [Chloroflexi bacterium]|nr:MBL fold metallo-hydrolase [Chloroflexota bacterium]
MDCGDLTVHIVSDGLVRFDGGAMFGVVPKALWAPRCRPDRKNRIRMGLNCLLIRAQDRTILVDNGVGPKEPPKVRKNYGLRAGKLAQDLKSHGVRPEDVDVVVLTHLHWDHCGGSTRLARPGEAVPTFPRATYLVQRSSWDAAHPPDERSAAGYHSDDYEPLFARGRLEFLDGDTEVYKGLWTKLTNGHAPGHQIVLLESGGRKVMFLGDLIPMHHHLPLPWIAAYDLFPLESMRWKKQLLEQAEREGWTIVFEHGYDQRAGVLERVGGRLELRPVEF